MITLEAIDAALDRRAIVRGGLAEFVRRAWHLVDPAALRWNWHHDVICDRLERVASGEIRQLCIMIPPGSTKTLITSVFWPTWLWLREPETKIISGSYGDICLDAARQHRDLYTEQWITDRWPEAARIPYQNTHAASLFKNDLGGFRFSTSVRGPLTGRHADVHIGDDLNKAQDAMGGAAYTLVNLEESTRWWTKILTTRQVNPATTRRVLIGQRLHVADVPGVWLAEDPTVHVLCLPMRYNPNHPHVCPPWTDEIPGERRTTPGELLWPAHYPEETVRQLEESLGPRDASAQLGQLPAPDGGAVFTPEWILDFGRLPAKRSGRQIQSWDMAIGESPGSSYVVGQVWEYDGADAYLLDQARARMDFTTSCDRLVDLVLEWPGSAREVVIEKKANGEAVANHLRHAYRDICRKRGIQNPPPINIILVTPRGSKLARAQGVTGLFRAGHVRVRRDAHWIGEYISEMVKFTGRGAETDDQVDATSQALTYLYGSAERRFVDAMQAARDHMRGAA